MQPTVTGEALSLPQCDRAAHRLVTSLTGPLPLLSASANEIPEERNPLTDRLIRTGGEEQVIVLYHPPSNHLICFCMAGWIIVRFSIVLLPVPGCRFAARRYHAEQSRKHSPDFIPGAVVSLGGGSKPPPLPG